MRKTLTVLDHERLQSSTALKTNPELLSSILDEQCQRDYKEQLSPDDLRLV